MRKIINFMKRKIKVFLTLFTVFLIIFVNCTRVFATQESDNGNNTWRRKEHQLVRKIQIIKAVFGKRVDEAALYATLVHRGTLTDYVNDSYDEDFSEESYRKTWSGVSADIGNLAQNIGQVAENLWAKFQANLSCAGSDDKSCVINEVAKYYTNKISQAGFKVSSGDLKTPTNTDLLALATIVMLDSSGWTGTYSDEAYQKAIAGERLVGNNFNDDDYIQHVIGMGMNGLFCTITDAVDTLSWFNPSVDYSTNTDIGVQNIKSKVSKYYATQKVCNYGFIGGTYSSVGTISDSSDDATKARYQTRKDIIAREIIDLAQYYRTDDGDLCENTGTVGSGEITNWRQYDERWGGLHLGSSSLTVKGAGCTTTALTYILAKSGTQLTVTNLDPGVYAQTGSYTSGGLLNWEFSSIAPNMHYVGSYTDINKSNYVQKISDIINTPHDGKQQFVLVEASDGGTHWVAVDHIENGVVYVLDPSGKEGAGLTDITTMHRWSTGGPSTYVVLYADDVDFGSTGGSSSSSSANVCGNAGTGSLDKLLETLKRLEGQPPSCKVRGKEGYATYTDSMDQSYAGTTTAFGLTQVYNADLAKSIGYTNFNSDMSNGCAEKDYIDQMGKKAMEAAVENVKADYNDQSGGKTLDEYQYHALALVYHHWPVGVHALIGKLAGLSDVRSYDAFHWFLYYNGLGGALGGLTRREVEFHLFYNGNYDADRDSSVNDSQNYYKQRVSIYKSETVN